MSFAPYLFFSGGTCRQAFEHYQRVLGGELEIITSAEAPEGQGMPGSPDAVMNATLVLDGAMLLGSDDPTGDGGPKTGVAVHHTVPTDADAERVFAALAEGGQVTMPVEETFWASRFGMCVDRYGTSWMVSTPGPSASA